MSTNSFVKQSDFIQSLSFIIFCIKNICGKKVTSYFLYCALAVFTAKIILVFQPIILGRIVDSFSHIHTDYLVGLIALFSSMGFIAALMVSFKNYFILLFREQLNKDLSIELLKKLQTFSHTYFHNSNVGKISQINNSGVEALHGFMVAFLSEIIPFLFEFSLIAIVIIAKFKWIISLPIFVIFLSYISINMYFSQREKQSLTNLSKSKIALSSDFYENVVNFDTVKITTSEKQRLSIFLNMADGFLKLANNHGKLFFKKSFLQNFTLYIGLFLILTLSVIGWANKQISAGEFVILNTYFFQITAPLISVLRSFDIFNKSVIDIKPMKELLQREADLKVKMPISTSIAALTEVVFNNVSFNYGNELVIHNASFTIPANKKVSLVGSTGSGKSTLAKLLLRFYDPTSGHITINNFNIRSIPFPELRKVIAYVPQDISLMNDTIFNNIMLGQPASAFADLAEINKATNLLDFVDSLTDGYKTIVGDRGLKLSGGQKQRIGIARALIRKPSILILDEYNSALDSSTEKEINSYLHPEILKCSILLIAHRLSSVVDSHQIIVIEKGEITLTGSHEFLLTQNGWFKNAWEAFIGFNSENIEISEKDYTF